MRMKMIVVELALLAALAGCAGAPQGQSALGGQATARSDASPAAAAQHLPPVWADPEFIKS